MSGQWQFQLRVYLSNELAEIARRDPADPVLGILPSVLRKHDATIKSQLDAFSDYVTAAEADGIEADPLYGWTKATLEDPEKRVKHLKAFAVHVKDRAVYTDIEADALEADLWPLVDGQHITRLSRHDTNPANNPQQPERFRKS
jgi:hypothetical protein